MARPDHPVHRPVGRPSAGGAGAAGEEDGLRRPRARLLGRPLRRAARRSRRRATWRTSASCCATHGLQCFAIGNHLVGQAVCDLIDERHQAIVPAHVWGDGDPEGVRQRAAREMQDTARAAARFGVKTVTGFTGSSIWHAVYAFPPTSQAYIDRGFADFATRWTPILDTFDARGRELRARSAPDRDRLRHRLGPARAARRCKAHRRFGFNFDPSHLGYQGVDYLRFMRTFGERIFNAHMKDVWWGKGDGTVGVFGGHTELRRRAPALGLPQRGPRHDRLRVAHRRAQRRRLRRPAERGVGRQPHGPRARRHRERGVLPPARLPAGGRRLRRGLRQAPAAMAGRDGRRCTPRRKLRCAMVGGGPRRLHRRGAPPRAWRSTASSSSSPARCRRRPRQGAGLRPRPRPARRPQPRLAGRRCSQHELKLPGRRAHRLRRRSSRPTTCTYEVAQAFAEAGFHVVCDKPLVHTSAQADELVRIASRSAASCSASPTTTPAIRWCAQAREMVRAGAIGEIRKVVVEYHQGWLATQARSRRQQAGRLAHRPGAQRRRPAPSATSARMPRTWSPPSPGLRRSRASAPTCSSVRARAARSTTTPACCCAFAAARAACCSPRRSPPAARTTCGCASSAAPARSTGGRRSRTRSCTAPIDAPRRMLTRGSPWLGEPPRRRRCRLPAGHPEGLPRSVRQRLPRHRRRHPRARRQGGRIRWRADYARVEDGARGVRFIEATVASAASDRKWTTVA